MTKLSILLLSAIMVFAGVGEATAATKRIMGSQLAAILYGHHHTVYMPTGIGIHVRYDSRGVQYSGGKRTGDIVRATSDGWCDYTGKRLNACMSIWKDSKKYVARFANGQTAFFFTID